MPVFCISTFSFLYFSALIFSLFYKYICYLFNSVLLFTIVFLCFFMLAFSSVVCNNKQGGVCRTATNDKQTPQETGKPLQLQWHTMRFIIA